MDRIKACGAFDRGSNPLGRTSSILSIFSEPRVRRRSKLCGTLHMKPGIKRKSPCRIWWFQHYSS